LEKLNIDLILQLGEGQFIEFKESFDKTLAKEICSFANASGGAIYLGIKDDGLIKGLELTNKLKSEIYDIARNCDPPILISIDYKESIVIIDVREGVNKPYSCSSGFYMRMGANSQKMNRDEILTLAIRSGKIRYDEQICLGFEWKDFDDDKFQYFLELSNISNNLSKGDILTNLKVLTKEGMTNAGILFFAKEPYKYIISSRVRCVHFYDTKRTEILDKKVVDKGIIGNIEFAVEYIKERTPVRYEIKDLARIEHPEYPINAYREAIVNSIIHFDYFLGDQVAVEKMSDKILIVNKGELLFSPDQFGVKSESRNRLLADLLSRTKYMEKAGTGVQRIKEACLSNNNLVEFSFSDSFQIIIKSNNVLDNVLDNVPDNVPDRIKTIMYYIEHNKYITISEMAKLANVNEKTVKRDLEKLRKNEMIIRIGPDKGGYWEVIKS